MSSRRAKKQSQSKATRQGRQRSRRAGGRTFEWLPAGLSVRQLGLIILLLGLLCVADLVLVRLDWIPITRRVLGWGAYPLSIALVVAGALLLGGRVEDISWGWEPLVGLEVALLALLSLTHRWTSDGQALDWAEQGRGGGLVGWAISSLLMDSVGPLYGRLILLALTAAGVYVLWRWAPERYRNAISRFLEAVAVRFAINSEDEQTAVSSAQRQRTPEPAAVPAREPAKPVRTSSARPKPKPKRTTSRRSPKPRDPGPWNRDEALPSLELLHKDRSSEFGDASADYKSEIIEQTLHDFGVPVRVVEVKQGPTVTQFGLEPLTIKRRSRDGSTTERKVSVRSIVRLSNDLALALAASPIRIEAPVPGQPYVGIEVPNDKTSLVSLRGVMESPDFVRLAKKSNLAIALGRDVSGEPIVADLGTMPHCLIAGATGSGKSVCINSVVTCLLLNNTPDSLKLVLIDPKMVELPVYNGVPHLMAPVVVDIPEAVGALTWLTREMDQRYQLFHELGARGISEYNRLARRRSKLEPLPHIVLVIDELSDMMMEAPDAAERSICRLAQMARATGIHLIIATQRPSVNVVTGLIKANFPARIAFAVTSQVDSRVILDQAGAEQLLGKGDMLFMSQQAPSPVRTQGCFVSGREISAVVKHWKGQSPKDDAPDAAPWDQILASNDLEDDLLPEAMDLIKDNVRVSTSYLQRKLHVGYPRAARLMELLEEHGLVGPDEGGGRGREVMVSADPDEGLD